MFRARFLVIVGLGIMITFRVLLTTLTLSVLRANEG